MANMIRVSKNEMDYIKNVKSFASVVNDIIDLDLNYKKIRSTIMYDDLIALAEPIAKKLGTIGDPHTTMIIQPDHIRITSDVIGKPIGIDDDKSECK